jgi:hypothetical protein
MPFRVAQKSCVPQGIGEMEVVRRMATSREDKEVEVEVAVAVAVKSEVRIGEVGIAVES